MVDIIDPGGRSVCKKTGIFLAKMRSLEGQNSKFLWFCRSFVI